MMDDAFYSDIGRESPAPVIYSFGGLERIETLPGPGPAQVVC
jgi:hypothetical protein